MSTEWDWRRLVTVAAVVALVVVGGVGFQAWRTGRSPSVEAVARGAGSDFAPVRVEPGRPLVLGMPSAPTRVRLYEDFHCEHCADFETEFGPTISAAQEAGMTAVALYPMSFVDEGSASAANALACAAENGFGQPYYLGLFTNSRLQWSDEQLGKLAAAVTPAVPAQFSTCVSTRAYQDWARSINETATADSVTGTPTLLVDNQPVDVNTLTPERLQQLLAPATTNSAPTTSASPASAATK